MIRQGKSNHAGRARSGRFFPPGWTRCGKTSRPGGCPWPDPLDRQRPFFYPSRPRLRQVHHLVSWACL